MMGSYQSYLQSSEWFAKKQKAIERAGRQCQVCSSKFNLDVHHNNYEHFGDESDTDLIVLCRKCHDLYHRSARLGLFIDVSGLTFQPIKLPEFIE